MPDDPDLSLLQRFARGDNAALGELARLYEHSLLGLALGITGNRELARDAVQDTWVRIIGGAAQFQGLSTVRTWMYRILINRAITLRQTATKRPALLLRPESLDAVPDAHSADDAEQVRVAMRELSPNHQLILVLCYHEGFSHEAAADVLGIPLGTLKSRLHAALTALRARLGAEVTP